jgi:SAM-dependent methyltransferase
VRGTGVDISTVFTGAARARAAELGVAGRVTFLHGDASGHVAAEPVDIASCLGVTFGNGVPDTLAHLERSLRPGGTVLIGHPYWRLDPPDQRTVEACFAESKEDLGSLPGQIERFRECGWDLVEMVLADQDSWDRYVAAQWRNIRLWLDANPDDELAKELREELTTGPLRYVTYQREYLGWGVFALMRR